MRGVIFNYLFTYLEHDHSYEAVDRIIRQSGVQSDGSYADGGMYADNEFSQLIASASKILDIDAPELLEGFGRWTFRPIYLKLRSIYNTDSYDYGAVKTAFDFIALLEEIHYKEVVKLYPESIFPHFNVIDRSEENLRIEYSSKRHLEHYAKGLLLGCGDHFATPLAVEMDKSDENPDTTTFTIRREDGK